VLLLELFDSVFSSAGLHTPASVLTSFHLLMSSPISLLVQK